MSDLSPETNKLLELARGGGALTDARRMQIKAGLLSQIAAGGALGAAATHATLGKAAWFSGSLAKGISLLALLSVVGVGLYVGTRAPKETNPSAAASQVAAAPPAAPVMRATAASVDSATRANSASVAQAPDPSAPNGDDSKNEDDSNVAEPSVADPSTGSTPGAGNAIELAPSSSAPDGTLSAAKSTSVVTHPASVETAPTADTLAGETRLLRAADQALRGGNAQLALSILDADAARYPHGALAPERSAERLIARCKLGQVNSKTAAEYLASHSNSAFAARIQDACGIANH